MRTRIFILAIACFFAVACGSSRKTQTTTPPSNSTASNAGNATVVNAKPGEYKFINDETYLLSGISDDATYGYSAKNAIKVGNGSMQSGPASERAFLNGLLGPNGEKVTYERSGSCCGVESAYAPLGVAMLDIYKVKYKGLNKPVILYINMYDPGVLLAPKGFTFRQ
jgi:hypothetical protein